MKFSPGSTKLKVATDRFHAILGGNVERCDQEEVHRWSEDAHKCFRELDEALRLEQKRVHDRLFGKLAEEHPLNQQEIQTLQNADTKVGQLSEIVKAQIIVLCTQTTGDVASRVDEVPLNAEPVLELIDRGSELVHWIREQEEAMSIWDIETSCDGLKSQGS